jgi:hypothetical protein
MGAYLVSICKYPEMDIETKLVVADTVEMAEMVIRDENNIPILIPRRLLQKDWRIGISTYCLED